MPRPNAKRPQVLNSRPGGLKADIVIVGAGPVGLSMGITLAEAGLAVVVLEGGGMAASAYGEDGSRPEIVDATRHAPLHEATASGLGGTSRFWGGRCLPFDSIDFERRDYVSASWPLAKSDVEPFYAAAAQLLGCGPARFVDVGNAQVELYQARGDGLRLDRLERWADEPFTPRVLGRRGWPGRLSVVPDTRVTDLSFDPEGRRVTGVFIAGMDQPVDLEGARALVIAGGGLETTRLLLNVQARRPTLFGGPGGALGASYMGHVSGSISDLAFSNPSDAALFAYREEAKSLWRRRLTLDAAVQRRERLPNVAFYPTNPKMGDATHGSGPLSALALIVAAPFIGPRLLPPAIRRMQIGDATDWGRHAFNTVADLPGTMTILGDVAYQRLIKRRRKPAVFLRSSSGRYPLHYHGEHLPTRESRVTLLPERTPGEHRQLRIDLRFHDRDAEGIVRAHEALDRCLRSSGLGRLIYHDNADRPREVLRQARDGFHQIGLCRMSSNPEDGVVDKDCRVFGVSNLYLAGTAVLPTSGQANPTFMAVALALRLAKQLRDFGRTM